MNIAIVEEKWKKGKIKNVAGYLLKAFAEDFSKQQPTLPTLEEERQAAIQAEEEKKTEKKRLEQESRAEAVEYLTNLSKEEQSNLQNRFLTANANNPLLQKILERHEFNHPTIQAMYFRWLSNDKLLKK